MYQVFVQPIPKQTPSKLRGFLRLSPKKIAIIALLLPGFVFQCLADEINKENSKENSKEIIQISAIDWCPQICLDKNRPGYVIELVKKIFEDTPYKLEIDIYPWSRAIKNVSLGKADALLSPAKSEAPNLLYPQLAVGYQQMCFFTLAESTWRYEGVSSLKGLQIGIATDTSIEELNSYVKSHLYQFQFQPYHERYLAQSFAKLEKKRMHSFLFTKNSTLFALHKQHKKNSIKVAGCVSKAPIYMAFTPINTKKDKIAEIMSVFDKKLTALKKTSYINKLMISYHLSTDS
ncbi:substrate-binding periplasmic protein [Colwellia psychrerythraea]|uniref:ABC-type transporter, periplasmic subunit family 3 n=1 Tax=Colwellia psychrerythraea TaxID=28229 RepID=A0A099KYU2_COLPS|nr:transporter substrate-binding domain-containing protein [Colwellia psychrerythraea]KGJ95002.1 ABC-type transporter, periplasmic subunit family 3 [Colwellia psychrerythraea]